MKKDENHKKINRAVQYDNLEATAKYLEKMAKDGWMLEKVSSSTQFHFVKSEPKELRFAVEIFSEGSEFDTHTIDSNLEYVEYCKKAGWNFICSAGKIDYFYTEDKNAPEIESDPKMKLQAIEKAQRPMKLIFPIMFICMGLGFLAMQLTMNLNAMETSFFHFSGFLLWVFAGILYAVQLISYLAWRGKARKAVKNGEKVPANKRNLGFYGAYAFILTCGVLHSVITVWVGLQYQEKIVFFIPCIWISMLLLILLIHGLSTLAEKMKMGRILYKVITVVVIPIGFTAILTGIITYVVLSMDYDEFSRRYVDGKDMGVFGYSERFVCHSGQNHHWGHFLLSFDQYTLEASNEDWKKMNEDKNFQETGVYQIPDGEEHVPVTFTWHFDIYQTGIPAIYNRILKEAKAGKDYRMLSIRFDYEKAVRDPALEVNGITVMTYEENYDGDILYRYLITDADTIVNARCDEALTAEEVTVIEKSFMH